MLLLEYAVIVTSRMGAVLSKSMTRLGSLEWDFSKASHFTLNEKPHMYLIRMADYVADAGLESAGWLKVSLLVMTDCVDKASTW